VSKRKTYGCLCRRAVVLTKVVVGFLQVSLAQGYQFCVIYHKGDSCSAGQVNDAPEANAKVATLTSYEALQKG
jgi:hypothetical protein